MKNLKFLSFGILMVSLSLTSCKKEADLQAEQAAPSQNNQQVFERSLTVYNADKTTSTTLRFSAASKELLNDIDNTEFTLVETPEADDEAGRPATKTTTGDDGSADYSDEGVSRLDASLPNLPNASQPIAGLPNASQLNRANEKPVLPEGGIQIDLPSDMKTKPFSLQVKSKDLNNSTTSSATQQAATSYYASRFYYISGYHRIKVTNYMAYSPVAVYFYNYRYGWNYSGYAFKVGYYQYARYQHCTRTVGARVYYNYYRNFTVRYYPYCS
ncbi:MAG TPA: hypothetical protein VER14_06655 [Phototrophicaceae bacterium]|nr:hypothetical protein [Phototrophicaceae bacterium]